ncbi:MAG: ribonuclease P protein component [Pigeon pea little leaf phytoplasma]|uniref:Ribonuclease P protein component n=2 Tax=Candidatus Phytoplasma fabacearum TaxID=2982628 RepID=A0ABU8ZT28_9MOLU|nr:ribonuclease P protein component ['Bituminaria bituminosa' little leaf phytoplasma]MDV3148682.1 ribonuclease P protein component [Pigeon pea little leaf phytoplasma]MDO7983525.1 ribonuclease P protein component ['Bituminaria bituminosa' little leaf phytoplasma]MDO8023817.1 ribonuclease P protein component ['Bituminaria bituminosa' little leaf phytoplasma]MDO8030645.1 ribonuclease P protein component ['Bituminaria bituminosa' little leaf phytoplasma]MDV3154088.1 ribonuclease P protein compon
MMKKKFILSKNKEINLIFQNDNKSVANYFFKIYYIHYAKTLNFKFALSINKRYGKSHERNLIKRRIRAIIYNYSSVLKPNVFFRAPKRPKYRVI